MGGASVELLAVSRAFPKALLSAKLAVSVLALGEVGWVPEAALLLLFCLDPTGFNEAAECTVGPGPGPRPRPCSHWCTEFADVTRSLAVARIGTSLRPRGGREGQIIPVCLVGRSRWGEEESVMVWVAEGWGQERRRRRRMPRDKRHMAAMVASVSHWSVGLHGSHHPFSWETRKVCLLDNSSGDTTKAPRHRRYYIVILN